MMTKYKEAMNFITKSRVYKNEGAADRNCIDKKNWTPHNLRRLVIDAQGIYTFNYTTNNSSTSTVEFITFKSNNVNQTDKEPKSIVDIIDDILVFCNIEEIILFRDGFLDEFSYSFEFQGLQKLAADTERRNKSFKRLAKMSVFAGCLNPAVFNGFSDESNLSDHLMSKDIKAVITEDFEVKRNELGLPSSFVLLPEKYGPDKIYDPTDKKCEGIDYKLSRWVYKQEQKVKKAKEEAEKAKAEKAKAETDKPQTEDTQYDFQVENAVKATINKLEVLYNPLWDKNYDAIFCETGLKFTVSGHNYNRIKSIADVMYLAWKEVAKVDLVGDFEKNTIDLSVNYIPGFHHFALNDRMLWGKGKDGKEAIKKTLTKKYLKIYNELYSKNPTQMDRYEAALTNCFILKKWGKSDMQLRFTGIKPDQKNEFERIFAEKVATTYRGGSTPGIVASCEIDTYGVGTLTYIMDMDGFRNEILFAHKIYTDYKITPSLSNVLLGLKMDGSPLQIGFNKANEMLMAIIAGSRSGKGTLTMSVLTALFGGGASVVYLDFKPDISAMLWDLERKYASQGLKLLSLDVGNEKHEFTGVTPVRTGPLNLLPQDEGKMSEFKTLRLCKLFQLVALIGKKASDLKAKYNIDAENVYIIVDEITSMNRQFTNLELYADKKLKAIRPLANKQKATEEDKALAIYYGKLYEMIVELNDNLVQGLTKDWGLTGLKMIVIGQELGSFWKTPDKNFNKSFGGLAVNSAHRSLSGRLQANEDTFQMTKSQALLADQTGVFCYSASSPSPCDSAGASAIEMKMLKESKFTQFRSFFSLIENDFNYEEFEAEGPDAYVTNHGKRFTSQLLANYLDKGDMVINQVVEELYDTESGCNREEVSFAGLLKVMQEKAGISDETLISNMNRGYEVFDGIFRQLGLTQYANLEEYLCDCSPDSLFSLNELMAMLGFGGSAPKRKVNSDVSMEEEINVFGDTTPKSNNNVVIDAEKYTEVDVSNNQKSDNFQKVTPQQQQPQMQSGQQPFSQQSARPQAQKYTDVHREGKTLNFKHDPIKTNHTFIKSIDAINAMKAITKQIFKDIDTYYKGVNAIKSFIITADGIIIFNEKAYAPKLDEKFINNFEDEDIRTKLRNGCLADLFFIKDVFKFKNLEYFEIEDEDYANDTVRLGLGIKGKSFTILYDRFPKLKEIIIGGIPYVRGDVGNPKEQEFIQPRPRLADLRNTASAINNYKVNPNTLMGKVWNSRPVKTLICAFGWTVAAQIAFTAAATLNPLGLFFGAMVASKAYSDYKKEHPNDYDDYDRQGRRPRNNSNYRNNRNGQSRNNNSKNRR